MWNPECQSRVFVHVCTATHRCDIRTRVDVRMSVLIPSGEDQCVHIDAVLPSAREVNGGGGEGGEGWEESGMGGAH